MEQLTPKQKEIIYLKYNENLSYAAISEIMEIEIKAVYKLMARALDSLKRFMLPIFFLITTILTNY
jgi:DNA-directed RNA polymerase specialized sigma24 family protein